MAKKDNKIILIVAVIVVLFLFKDNFSFMGDIAAGDTVQRNFQKTDILINEQITIQYLPVPSGQYGVKEPVLTGWTVVDAAGGQVGTDNILRISGGSGVATTWQAPASISSATEKCYNDDLYFYETQTFTGEFFTAYDTIWTLFTPDNVDVLSLSQDCGDDSFGTFGADYCMSGSVYRSRDVYDRGCTAGACFQTTTTEGVELDNCATKYSYATCGCTVDICDVPNTKADTNCDSCVHDDEYPFAVSNWLNQAGITDTEFPFVISEWLNQNNCGG